MLKMAFEIGYGLALEEYLEKDADLRGWAFTNLPTFMKWLKVQPEIGHRVLKNKELLQKLQRLNRARGGVYRLPYAV